VAGEWWTPLILRDVAYGVGRFREIQDDLGISANVLSDRLESLVSEGILETHLYQERPSRHEYRLTQKGGELVPVLLALMQWGDRWKWPQARGPVRVEHAACGEEVRVEVRCAHCECEVPTGELRAQPRPGVMPAPGEHEPGYLTARRLISGDRGVPIRAGGTV